MQSTEMNNCSIFQAIGKQVKGTNKCAECPFTSRCPQDILDDSVAEILKEVGQYVKKERQKRESNINKME